MLDKGLNTSFNAAKQIGCIYTQHMLADTTLVLDFGCVKSVQTWRFFWSVFSPIPTEYGYLLGESPNSVRIKENTNQKKIRISTLLT